MSAPVTEQPPVEEASNQSTAMTRFSGDQFLARKKVFSFLGQKFHIYGPGGELRFFIKQKAFKLKEAITVYADETMSTPMLKIQARSIMDFSGTYDIHTPEGEHLGSFKREGLKSILRDKWLIFDTDDNQIGIIEEDSMMAAMLRRFLNNLIPQTFNVTIGGQQVAVFKQHFNPFVAKYDIDFSLDDTGAFDRRMGIAAVILLLAIEGRQS
ncbi:MAG: hypothetical protein ACOC9W_03195 [Persicimonas sp.]